MSKRVLIPVAQGVEDIETVTQIDVLRRAGADVVVASVETGPEVTAARGTRLVADTTLDAVLDQEFDLITLPGGLPGAERLRDCEPLIGMLRRQRETGRYFGAICASPAYVLQHHGLLEGHEATCFPALLDRLRNPADPGRRVVVSGNCVTSQGPATAIDYSLTLVELLFGANTRKRVAEAMLVQD